LAALAAMMIKNELTSNGQPTLNTALEVAFVVKEFIFTRYKAMKMHATRERHKWLPEWKGISLISLLDVTIFIIHSTCIILYHISVILQAVYAYVLQRQQQDISD